MVRQGDYGACSGVHGPGRQTICGSRRRSGPALRDFYLAETLLAFNADGVAASLLHDSMSRTAADGPRLAHAVMLGQLLLLQKRYKEYAKLATDEIIPRVEKARWSIPETEALSWSLADLVLDLINVHSLDPLLAPDFLAKLPAADVDTLVKCWQRGATSNAQSTHWFVSQLGLYAAYQRLGKGKEAQQAERRFDESRTSPANPFGKEPAQEVVDGISTRAEGDQSDVTDARSSDSFRHASRRRVSRRNHADTSGSSNQASQRGRVDSEVR